MNPPPGSPPAQRLHGIAPEHHGKGERLLHVDDEPTVTISLQRLLQKLGYRIVSFNNPHAATDHFRNAPQDFDLVITDLMMPGMTGLEVADEVRALRPALPIVLLSALAAGHHPDALAARGIRDVIVKPAGIAVIAATIRRVLDSALPLA